MKYLILFSEKNKKYIMNLFFAEFSQRVVKVNLVVLQFSLKVKKKEKYHTLRLKMVHKLQIRCFF